MIRFALFIVLACVALKLTEASIKIEEVFKVNSTEIIEDVSFDSDDGKSFPKGVVVVKIERKKPKRKPVGIEVTHHKKKVKKSRHHGRHLRRRCCTAGELTGKHGLSCLIPRNYKNMFYNLITYTRQKYQGTLSQRSSARSRISSKTILSIYKTVNMCVMRQKKSVVTKCCLAYLRKPRRNWG